MCTWTAYLSLEVLKTMENTQFSSHFFKTAFALAVADKGFVPPYIGWDGPPSW